MAPCISTPLLSLGSDTTPGKALAVASDSDLRLDLKERTNALFEGLRLVLREHKMPEELIVKFQHQYVDHMKRLDPLVFYGGSKAELKHLRQLRKRKLTDDEEGSLLKAEQVWVKECKFLLTYPMAKFLRSDLPEKPLSGGFKPQGSVKRWIKARINAYNIPNIHLWYSWFQAKRSCLPFSNLQMPALFKEHFEALSSPDPYKVSPANWGAPYEVFDDPTFNFVLNEVEKSIFHSVLDENGKMSVGKAELNSHACFEQSRSRGGNHRVVTDVVGCLEIPVYPRIRQPELFSMKVIPCVRKQGKLIHNFVEERTTIADWELWDTLERGGPSGKFIDIFECNEISWDAVEDWDARSPEVEFLSEEHRQWLLDNPRPLLGIQKREGAISCEVTGVLEPNKCRMISKGEALPYYLAKPLQQAMLRAIQKLPCFSLTGRPFYATDIYQLLEKAKKTDNWLSIDYSAATDGLSWKYSSMILERITNRLPAKYQKLAFDVLGPHELHYPDGSGVEGGMQTNGQLMGSVLSFPILCLANLGLYLWATKKEQKGWTHEERLRHVLINGDDMLYSADPIIWQRHIHLGEMLGLKMSVGKAYSHCSYANINSLSVVYDLRRLGTSLYGRGSHSPRVIPFLNVGLCLSRHKVQGRTDDPQEEAIALRKKRVKQYREAGLSPEEIKQELETDEFLDGFVPLDSHRHFYAESHTHEDSRKGIVENIPLALEGCLNEKMKRSILNFILSYHAKEIKRQTTLAVVDRVTRKKFLMTRNLFGPLLLGGCGILAPEGFRFKITDSQLYLMQAILEERSFQVRPLNFPEEITPLSVEMEPFRKPETVVFQTEGFLSSQSSFARRSCRKKWDLLFHAVPILKKKEFIGPVSESLIPAVCPLLEYELRVQKKKDEERQRELDRKNGARHLTAYQRSCAYHKKEAEERASYLPSWNVRYNEIKALRELERLRISP